MYRYTDGLLTERLVTRFLTMEDVTIWAQFLGDKQNSPFIDFDAELPAMARANKWIEFALKRYRENRFGLQALILKDTGEFIGQCGLLLQEVDGKPEIEVGYHLLLQHWGKGYATEAARLFRDYAFQYNLTDSVISIIHSQNATSKQVAMRNGMQLWKTDGSWHDSQFNIFRVTREEWERIE